MINMDDIMNASLGEVSNKLSVTFKKTVLVRDYETEVMEAVTSVELDHGLSFQTVCTCLLLQDLKAGLLYTLLHINHPLSSSF